MKDDTIFDQLTVAQKEQILANTKESYNLAGNLPIAWLLSADGLLAAARTLSDAYRAPREINLPDMEGVQHLPREMFVLGGATLLYGFALENIFKARALQQGNRFVIDDEFSMPGKLKTHRLDAMAEFVDFAVTAEELEMLKNVSEVMRYSGRYPVATKIEDHIPKMRLDGSIELRPHVSLGQIDLIEQLILRLGVTPGRFGW